VAFARRRRRDRVRRRRHLWRSEDSFHAAEQRFVELLGPYTPDGIDLLDAALTATERATCRSRATA
jgi:hypothetical protein